VVAPREPEEVVTTAKKSRSRNALEANWRENLTALVSNYGYLPHSAKARAAPSKSFFDNVQAKAQASVET
jgi:hypothetical protein